MRQLRNDCLLALAALVVLANIGCGGVTTPTPNIAATEQAIAERIFATLTATAPRATDTPTRPPMPTPTNTLTPTPTNTPMPTVTPTPKIGVRSNPIPIGQSVEFTTSSKEHVRLTLTRVAWGEEAEALRNADEKFITYHATEGNVMLLVYFEADYLDGPQDEKWGISWLDFNVEIQKVLYRLPISVWDKELRGTAYPGGTLAGWLELQVPVGTTAEDVKIVYNPTFEDIELWFAVQ